MDILDPGEDSGTFDTFIELVPEDIAEKAGADATTRRGYRASSDDRVTLHGVASCEEDLGWIGVRPYRRG